MTDTHDSPRLRAPGDARGSSPPPSGTGETPSSSADDVLRSRAAAEPPATPASSEAASAPTPGSSEGGSAAPPAPNAVQRAGTAIDAAVDSAVVATANVPVALPVAQLIDRTVITPFTAIMQGPPPNAGTAGIVRYGIDSIAGVAGVVMGAISLPGQILDTAVASLSSAIMPPGMGFPAACAGTTLHMGMPHSHIPPPAPPVILPSIGDATGPGCLTVMINGMPSLRASDVGFAPTCGSAGVLEIITGSASVFINGKRAARAMDMTRVCNPLGVFSAMAAMSAAMSGLDLAMAALPVVQGIAGAAAEYETMESSTGAEAEAAGMAAIGQGLNAAMMAAQAAADAATNALRATVGVPPAILPPAPVVLGMLSPIPIGRPVLIGGIPVPPLGDMLNHGIAQRRQRMRERRRPTHLDGDGPPHLHPHGGDDADARPRPHPDDDGNQGHCREGHPVDSVTGAVFDDYIDYRSAGLFHWRRTYNSQLAVADGPVGRGFRHDYAVTLRALLHRCTYTDVFGRETRFPRFDPEMNQVSALGWLLTRESPSRYRLERKGQPTRIFQLRAYSRTARLTTVSLGARSLELEYDRNDRLAHVTESVEGRRETRYLFEYDREGHIVGLMLEGGTRALVEHGYDRTGHLIRVRRLDGSSMQYGYDVGHRMTEWTDPTGYVFKWSYDAEGRCVWTTGVDGLLSRRLAYTARTTTVTASDDGVWTHHHRADGLLTKKEDPLGGALERLVDGRGRVRAETDSGGQTIELLYDEHGRIEGRRDSLGRVLPSATEDAPPPEAELPLPSTELERHLGTVPWRRVDGPTHPPPAARDTAAWAVRPVPPISPKRAFDHLRNVVESIDDRGSRRTFRYDGAGELIEFRDGDGATWGFRTHRWKLLAQETNPLGHTTRYRYDNEGNLSMVIDPLVAMTEYAYDQKGRLTQVRRHGATQHEYAYDAADRLVERRNGAGTPELRVLAYDRSRPTRIEVASGATHELTYDGRGRVRTADVIEEGRRISLDCARDGAARVTRDERDGAGLRRRFLHDGSTELVLFDRFRFVTRPTEDGGFLILGPTGTLEVARMREHSVLERQLGSGSYDLQQFDSSGRLIGHVLHRVLPGRTTDVWGARYDRSAEGDLTSVWDSGRGGARYTYDAAHRLETYDRADTTQRYEYDPANNILAKPGLARAEYAEGNRLSETEEEVFLHDESQRLTARRRRRDGLFTRYHYDAEGQLRRVETRDGSGVSTCDDWTADYDALGRRVRFGRGGAKTELHWDGFRLAGETSPSGRLRLYVYQAVDSFIPFAFIDYASREAPLESGSTYYVHHHACGLPLMIEDSHGRTVWWASAVEPYGDIDLHPSSTVDYALRWPGHRLDADLGLFYNRFRDYDPKLARYLQPDPLGLGGGPNLYAYATNPLSDVDLLGLTLCPEGVARQKAQMDEARALSEHLPADRRQIVLDSMEEIHRREREFAAPGTRAQATEMRGEADATLHMLRESRDPTSPFHGMEPATRYGAGSGMDQIWVRRAPDGSIAEVLVIEAKGRNGTSGRAAELSPGNPTTGLPAQMSTQWIESRARAIAADTSAAPSERAAATAVLDGLRDGTPEVHARLVTGSYRADEAPSSSPRRRRSDEPTSMEIPTRPDGAPASARYPPDGIHS